MSESTQRDSRHHHHPHKRARNNPKESTMHHHEHEEPASALVNNPFMHMFNIFRDELDEHHDRRERVIKASRDITALSKKMIFTLQRIRSLISPLPPFAAKDISQRQAQIDELFTSLIPDLVGLNANRYQKNISGGIQEYLEARAFQHYLTQGTLLTVSQAKESLPKGIELIIADYMGGVFDVVGEIMRMAITLIATTPLPSDGRQIECPKILNDLREIRSFFESFDIIKGGGNGSLGKEVEKKLSVMRTCVEKVELAVYSMIVRGNERPKGWVPDTDVGTGSGGMGRYDEDT